MKSLGTCCLSIVAFCLLGLSSVSQAQSAVKPGAYFTCALTAAGGVKCWGKNTYGELGDNQASGPQSYAPVDVVGLGSGVSAIAVGFEHACALTTGGGVKCWGLNSRGQLGDNGASGNQSYVPVDVVGLSSGVSAIAMGGYHSCAVTTAGGVKCWGLNTNGQLGDNAANGNQSFVPVDVVGLSSGVRAVAAGLYHNCAVTTAGSVKCWGDDNYGQLGDNYASGGLGLVPVDVVGLSSGVSAIAIGGYHSCAVTTAGGVKCWGLNTNGQLGDNAANGNQSFVPVDVVGLSSGVRAVAAGLYHNCAVTTAGGVKCWGDNSFGELGDNGASENLSFVPVDVVGLSSGVRAVAAGGDNNCTLTTAGGLECWGINNYGQLGDGTTTIQPVPETITVAGLAKKVWDDIDGDGKSDFILGDSHTDDLKYWPGGVKSQSADAGSLTAFLSTLGIGSGVSLPGFTQVASCDINGDGTADLVWLNYSTGATQIWLSGNSATRLYPGKHLIADMSQTVLRCGDFDGDGKADLFWNDNGLAGANQIWYGGVKANTGYPGNSGDAFLSGVGDIDGDGKDDVIWTDRTTRAIKVWKGGLKSGYVYLGSNSEFTVFAVGDYDGDGKADLLLKENAVSYAVALRLWPDGVKSASRYLGTYNPYIYNFAF